MMIIFRSILPPTIHITNKSARAFKLTVNIWKSYRWTADKDVNMKVIYLNSTENKAWYR